MTTEKEDKCGRWRSATRRSLKRRTKENVFIAVIESEKTIETKCLASFLFHLA